MSQAITVAVINYNGSDLVCRSLESVLAMDYPDIKVIVLDDCSTDGSPEAIAEKYPEITIYREANNTGRLNMLRNKALAFAGTDRVLITDNDILFDRHCLAHLVKSMDADPAVVTCTPRLMCLDDPQRLYAGGGIVHYLGVSIDEGRGRIYDPAGKSLKANNSSGGIMLVDKGRLNDLGGFDEGYLMGWGDDGEFYRKLLIAGKKCMYVPDAVARHEDKPFSGARGYRAVGQIYNRWRFILTSYSLLTLLVVFPAFIVFELLQLAFFMAKGMPLLYFRGNMLVLRQLPSILDQRRRVQGHRRIPDRQLLDAGPILVGSGVLKGSGLMNLALDAINRFFSLYWALVRKLLPGLPVGAGEAG